jgi:hypothetical protein
MLTILLTLILTPPPATDLDGAWRSDAGTTLTIDGGVITVTDDASHFGFVSRLTVSHGLLRLSDKFGTLTRAYRIEGRALVVEGVAYWRLGLEQK